MRLLTIPTLLLIISIAVSVDAQPPNRPNIKLSIQENYQPTFEINDNTFGHTYSNSFKLLFYQLTKLPAELGLFISQGRNKTIDYFYGMNLAYLFLNDNSHWLKGGVELGRFKLGRFQDEVSLGAVLEDEYHESFKPYIEWEWNLSKQISLFTQAGYRFLRSDTRKVTNIVDRYEDGTPKVYNTSAEQVFHGSGLEFSLGLSITLF